MKFWMLSVDKRDNATQYYPTMANEHGSDAPTKLLYVKDVAVILNVSSRSAIALITSGKLPAGKIGKFWRVRLTTLNAYIERNLPA